MFKKRGAYIMGQLGIQLVLGAWRHTYFMVIQQYN